MAKKLKKTPPGRARPFVVPDYVRDPEKLRDLCSVTELDQETLLAIIERDYGFVQQVFHPAIYEARGAEKGGLLLMALQHCLELASSFEEQGQGNGIQLLSTLQHVQAQLAVLLADYEQQLRERWPTTKKDAPDA